MLSDYELNPERAAEIVWNLSKKNSAPNGGIMRTFVVGLWNKEICVNAEKICKLTHASNHKGSESPFQNNPLYCSNTASSVYFSR